MLETDIKVKLDQFDGPLALLLHLIQREEMSLDSLDLTKVTGQYLDYIQQMQNLNFDIAGEYLFMAATLLYLKSEKSINEDQGKKKGLGEEDFDITSKDQLIEKLQQLEKFQKLGQQLWALPKKGYDIFLRPKVNRKLLVESALKPMTIDQLTMVMIDYLRREKRKFSVVKRDRLSIKEKLITLKDVLTLGSRCQFSGLIKTNDINEVVITFISILELARLKKVKVYQAENWGEIYIDTLELLTDFDLENANGFEDTVAAAAIDEELKTLSLADQEIEATQLTQ